MYSNEMKMTAIFHQITNEITDIIVKKQYTTRKDGLHSYYPGSVTT